MAFMLQAPYPTLQTTSYLPSPLLGDSIASSGTLEFKRAMDGTKYSYVKSRNSRRKFVWTFSISHHKALELRAFFDSYNSSQIKITDHLGKVYLGYFTTNPFELEAVRRSVASPGNYTQHQVQITFEGFAQG